MTLALTNKNTCFTYELAYWLNFKSNEHSTISKIKYHLGGRIALVSLCLLSLAESVSRATLGSMLLAGSCEQKTRNFSIDQIQKGAHARSISFVYFRSIIFPKNLVDYVEAAKPKKNLSPKERLNRTRQGKELIAAKFAKGA